MKFFLSLIFSATLILSCARSEQTAQTPISLEDRMDGLFAAYAEGTRPGYGIAILSGEDIVFAKGYGYADVANQKPLTADTAFNLASLSKQFTAASTALLIKDGDLNLDDPLQQHFPETPEFAKTVTIGHLIYMTSGLPEYYSRPSPKGGWASEDRFTVQDAIEAVFAAEALDFEPGSQWNYSNINYQLLAETTASVSGLAFNDFMQERIFKPLSMENSWIDAPIDTSRPERSLAYNWSDEVSDWVESPRLSPHYGGSGMYSSLNDLAIWISALFYSEPFGQEFREQMLATRKYDHDKVNDAFGLVYGSYRGFQTIWYEGGDYGVSTYIAHVPNADITVICLANFGDAGCWRKARDVKDMLIAFPLNNQ
ncbi:MAG: serine hydrolase domain-containing protein [Pseudomonadota bacterium]